MCTLAAASVAGNAQTLMTIQVSNYLAYDDDVADPATFATSPGIVPGTGRLWPVVFPDVTRSSLWHTRYFHNGSACVTRS